MTEKQAQIVSEAREWIGTPYHHHQRVKGAGVDCVGLIIGVGLNTGSLTSYSDNLFFPYRGYSRTPNPNKMGEAMRKFLVEVDTPEIGDIAWIEARGNLPMHLGIKSGDKTIIHACGVNGKVVENTLINNCTWWRYV